MLLDETLPALDAKVRLPLREMIRSVQWRLGTTTLFVTYDQEGALPMADRAGVMREGRLEQMAAPDELYSRPATAFAAVFVGTINRIPAQLTARGVDLLGREAAVHERGARAAGERVTALVRPEGPAVTEAASGPGIVTGKSFLGSVTRVLVLLSTPADPVNLRVDLSSAAAAGLAVGECVAVALAADSALVMDAA